MKSYRVLEAAPRLEVELLGKLDQVGFASMLRPVAHWERSGWDLALVRQYVPGAVEGRLLLSLLFATFSGAASTRTGRRDDRGRRRRWRPLLGDATPRGDHR